MPIFTRLLTTAEYGQFSVFNSWLGIATSFVTINISYGVIEQGLVKFSEDRNVFASSLQGLGLTLTLIWTVVYLVFRNFWNTLFSLSTVQMLAMLLMIWASTVCGLWAAEQRVKVNYKGYFALTVVVTLAKPIVGIIFVLISDDKVTARILGLALVELICYTGLFFSQMKRGGKFYHAYFWKYAITFSIPLVPHYLSQTVLSGADRIMIGRMIGESEAGIYSLAYSVSLLMAVFNTAMGQALNPWMYQKIKDKRAKDIASVAYVILILIAILNVFFIAFTPEIVRIFAPADYYNAIWVIPPVTMSVFFMYMYDVFVKFELYYEKTKFVMIATVTAAVLNIVLNYIFIDLFGYFAAGYTTLGCYIVYAMAHYFFMRKVCRQYLMGEEIFNVKILMAITIIFMTVGFTFLIAYKYWIIRYLMITLIIIILFICRNYFIKSFEMLRKR